MSAPRNAPDGVHPLARPFMRFSGPRTGLFVVIALGVLVVLGFGLETVLTADGLAKYPEVYGAYELLPMAALAVAILAGWVVRWVLGRRADYYEDIAGDLKERDDA